ncbi:Uncharacterised protein [Escherichia coli]|nr:Uncharacterised protein [Escherichia coli]
MKLHCITGSRAVAVNDDMAYAFHHALSDSSLGADEVEEIKAGLRAAFANVTIQPEPVVPDDGREKFEALVRFHAVIKTMNIIASCQRRDELPGPEC